MKRTRLSALAASAVAASLFVPGGMAGAANFQFGDVSVAFDNTISLGTGMRTSKQDCRHVSDQNGGCGTAELGYNWGANEDDGNVNFDQWDVYSAAAKITTDLEARWRNYGAFVRTRAFYDYWGYEEVGTNSTPFGKRPISDQFRGDKARNAAGRGFDLLDAFVFGNVDVAGQPLTLRVGQQVVNWGESLFIRGGINSYLPIDVAAIRTPGAEIKEALMPVGSVYANLGLPASMNLEAVYFWDWKKTKLDPVGTFFATNDFFGPGGVYQVAGSHPSDDPDTFMFSEAGILGGANAQAIRRGYEPDSQGQYGVKLGHYANWLNNGTDLGLYFVNYHSNLPILTFTDPILSGYLAQYPEDIRMFGASFNTTIDLFGGTALAGEIAYSPNTPFQINTTDLNALISNLHLVLPVPDLSPFARAASFESDGRTVRGYTREKVITGQLQTTSIFTTSEPVVQLLGADNFIMLANAGFQYLPSVSDEVLSVLNGPKASVSHPDPTIRGVLAGGVDRNYHADTVSWGYQFLFMSDYNNAFGTAWTVTPNLSFAHGVKGMSAGPIGPGFVENAKSVSLGVTAAYQNSWRANLQYTNNFGNATRNIQSDRDFVTFNVSYAF